MPKGIVGTCNGGKTMSDHISKHQGEGQKCDA